MSGETSAKLQATGTLRDAWLRREGDNVGDWLCNMALLDLSKCSPETIDSTLDRLPREEQVESIVAFLKKFNRISAKQDAICEQGEAIRAFVEKQHLSQQLGMPDDNDLLVSLQQEVELFHLRRSKRKPNKPGQEKRVRLLEKIRRNSGWNKFPDCLPEALRKRRNGNVTDFGIRILVYWCTLAEHTSFDSAKTFFESEETGCISEARVKEAIEYFKSREVRSRRCSNNSGSSSQSPDVSARGFVGMNKRRRLASQCARSEVS